MPDPARAASPFVITVPRGLVRFLVATMLALLAIHLVTQYDRFHGQHVPWQLDELFDVDEEQTIPNWFSSALLAFGALLMAAIAGAARGRGSAEAPRWAATSLVMLYMSFDEVAGLHETFNSLSPISWTVPFGLLALAVGAYFLPFVLKLRRATVRGIVVAGFIYVMGAVGIEFITSRIFTGGEFKKFDYAILTALEEGLEMSGAILTIRTLLAHMRAEAGTTDLALELAGRAAASGESVRS